MGFEVIINGRHYDYTQIKTLIIKVDKHDIDDGNTFEHTTIEIETRGEHADKDKVLALMSEYVYAVLNHKPWGRKEKEMELFGRMRDLVRSVK